MTNLTNASLEDRLIELMRHLGIERAHFAACMPRDWVGLLTRHKHRVASLTLMCPMGIELAPLTAGPPPILIVTGDQGRAGADAIRDAKKIAGAVSLVLENYFSPPWADPIRDRRDAIGNAMKHFIESHAHGDLQSMANLSSAAGESAGITYSCHGSGAPLLLMPLALSPSQWQPLIEQLSENFRVIILGGAHLGMVAHLETRAQSSYMRVIDQLFDELDLKPGQSLLEVGCGSGAIVRRLAGRSRGSQSDFRRRREQLSHARGGGVGQARRVGWIYRIPSWRRHPPALRKRSIRLHDFMHGDGGRRRRPHAR